MIIMMMTAVMISRNLSDIPFWWHSTHLEVKITIQNPQLNHVTVILMTQMFIEVDAAILLRLVLGHGHGDGSLRTIPSPRSSPW